jgi:hypothetical protein
MRTIALSGRIEDPRASRSPRRAAARHADSNLALGVALSGLIDRWTQLNLANLLRSDTRMSQA